MERSRHLFQNISLYTLSSSRLPINTASSSSTSISSIQSHSLSSFSSSMSSISRSSFPPSHRSDSNSNHILDLRTPPPYAAVSIPAKTADFKLRSSNGMESAEKLDRKIVTGDEGYVLEDVPHLSDYIPDLPVSFFLFFFFLIFVLGRFVLIVCCLFFFPLIWCLIEVLVCDLI